VSVLVGRPAPNLLFRYRSSDRLRRVPAASARCVPAVELEPDRPQSAHGEKPSLSCKRMEAWLAESPITAITCEILASAFAKQRRHQPLTDALPKVAGTNVNRVFHRKPVGGPRPVRPGVGVTNHLAIPLATR